MTRCLVLRPPRARAAPIPVMSRVVRYTATRPRTTPPEHKVTPVHARAHTHDRRNGRGLPKRGTHQNQTSSPCCRVHSPPLAQGPASSCAGPAEPSPQAAHLLRHIHDAAAPSCSGKTPSALAVSPGPCPIQRRQPRRPAPNRPSRCPGPEQARTRSGWPWDALDVAGASGRPPCPALRPPATSAAPLRDETEFCRDTRARAAPRGARRRAVGGPAVARVQGADPVLPRARLSACAPSARTGQANSDACPTV